MGGDGEQRLGEFPDGGNQEVFNVLGCQNHDGIPLTDSLHGVADVLNGGQVGQEQVQLVDGCHGVADADEGIAHVGENIEQHGIAELLVGVHETLDTEAQELVICDVGVAVEILAFRANTHGVQSQADLPEDILGVEVLFVVIVHTELLFAELVQVGKHGIVQRGQLGEVGGVRNAELGIELLQQDLDGIDLGIGEALVGAEEVFQERDVLRQPGYTAKCFRRAGIVSIGIFLIAPDLGFQYIDQVLAGEEVDVAAAKGGGQILVFMLHIQTDHTLAGLPQVRQQELQQMGLALAGVTKDQGVAVGLVIASAVQVDQDVGTVLITANVEALGVGAAGEVEGIQVGHRAGRQDSLILRAEAVASEGHNREVALLLAQGQPVHRDLGTGQLHGNVRLQLLQCFRVFGFQLNEHGAVEQGFPVLTQVCQQSHHILEVTLGFDCLVQIVVTCHKAVLAVGIVHDLPLFHRLHQPVIDPQGDTVAVRKLGEDRLFLGGGGIFLDRPGAAVSVTDDVAVGKELDGTGSDAVEEVLGCNDFLLFRGQLFRLSLEQLHSSTPSKN